MKAGLRIDVDTLSGTREGVPSLLRTLDRHGIRGAFFFSVGPDNMGRNLWRLFKPAFLWKMLRTKAASLYGWDILLMGTAWPGPRIGIRCESMIRDAARAGHEIGVHAWDHRLWQAKSDRMSAEEGVRQVRMAFEELTRITGKEPECSASPGWRCTEELLRSKESFPFRYNSDCRGNSIFLPVVDGKTLTVPQIPLNLPTYDELYGRDGITNENYNSRLLDCFSPDGLNLLTIHAEVEGRICADLFDRFLTEAKARGIEFCALGDLLPEDRTTLPRGRMIQGEIPGREGVLALQGSLT